MAIKALRPSVHAFCYGAPPRRAAAYRRTRTAGQNELNVELDNERSRSSRGTRSFSSSFL